MIRKLFAAVRELIERLPAGSSRFMVAYSTALSALSILDIVAMGILALVLTPMIQGNSIDLPLLGEVGPAQYPWILVSACGLLILKAVFAIAIQWFATRRFAAFELSVGDKLFNAYIRAPWSERLSRSTAELVRMADVGVANTIGGVLMPTLNLPSLAVTFISVILVIVVAQPVTAGITLAYLGIVSAFLYFVIARRSIVAGEVNLRYSLRITKLMTEMVSTLKEITLRNKFDEVAVVVHDNRERSTRARANLQFLGIVPQRVLEAALVGGFVLVGGVSYWLSGAAAAFSSIALFGVAGFRIVPTIVNFQTAMTTTANSLPHLQAVLGDIDAAESYIAHEERVGGESLPKDPQNIELEDVSFSYPGSDEPAVSQVSLRIPIGTSVGFVGASGSGKSTLIDILLGLQVPQHGTVRVDGHGLESVLGEWRSRVGYVPQDVALFDATIAQNVALTWGDDYDEEQVWRVLDRAQLSDMVKERPGGLNANVGERGWGLSGGQRQRLGIARALYSSPLILVLDEATSALDTSTEEAVAESIRSLHGEVTVITVAHRLSTIRHCDQVCFMRAGRMTAHGTFDQLVGLEPDFALQAHLAGLV